MGTEREFDALASDAIASSEKEFFAEAMGQPDEAVAVEAGDRSLESMGGGLEGRQEPDDDDGEKDESEAEVAAPEAKAEGEDDQGEGARDRDEQGRFKPKGQEQQPNKTETPAERGLRGELVAEREKRKTTESEFATYRAEADRRFAALEARIAAQPAPQPKPEPAKDTAPDRWTDPEGYDRWFTNQVIGQVRAEREQHEQRRVAWSFEEAKAKHGDAFSEAYQAANSIPSDHPAAKQIVDQIMSSPNPGERLLAWHRDLKAAREIGNDPNVFRERTKAELREVLMKDPEFRKEVLAGLQREAHAPAEDGGPRTTTKLPPSLSSARGGAPSRAPMGGSSDAELFSEVMG